MKTQARVVVIGGGVTGCSVLYHLAKAGWTDAVLLERRELTSGSSWHAAGNLFALTSPANAAALQKYTIELYPALEAESEQSCGYHPVGGLHLARSPAQVEALKVAQSRGRRSGIETAFLTLAEARERAPILDTGALTAALWEPGRGYVDPAGVTHAFARAARKLGATIHRQTPVIETTPTADGWAVVTPGGTIHCEYLVNAAGLWAREVAALAGVRLPLMPVQHHYMVTETVPEIAAMAGELPAMGYAEAGIYARQEGQGLLLGAYERHCHLWAEDGTPADFDHELLPDDLGRMEENLAQAVEVMPCLASAGIKRVINGPMIFSPDLGPLLGPYPGLRNYFCACGVMTGFNQGGGVGKVIAEWIIEGEPGLDVLFWDVARFGAYAGRAYTRARTRYYYEHRTERTYPYQEIAAGRPLKTVPIHDRLAEVGAVFGEAFGLETPLWYARAGEVAEDRPSFRRTNWFDAVGEECRAIAEAVGLFEITGFAKYRVSGPGAEAWLEHLLANAMPGAVGRTRLSPMLSPKGRLIGDFTVSRLTEDRFLLLGAGRMQRVHMRHFAAHSPADGGATVENLSNRLAGLQIAGPGARALLARVAEGAVDGAALPFLNARVMEVGGAPDAIVVRVSFTGELGYEIYCAAEYQRTLFARLMAAGTDLGLRLAGSRAMMALRLEKAFPSWGLELSPDYTPFDAGLERFVRLQKPDFVGRTAALAAAQRERTIRLALLAVDAADADASGGEAVFRDGEAVGYVTSGGFGHRIGRSLALAYIDSRRAEPGAEFAVEILGERRPAEMAAGALYDPAGARMRG